MYIYRKIIDIFIKLNAIFNITCALYVVNIIPTQLSIIDLHLSLLNPVDYWVENFVIKRFFAYWIFTHGLVKLTNNKKIISIVYYTEAIFYFNEYYQGVFENNIYTIFSISLYLFLGYISWANP
jgi:uncharacterized protein YvpB